jgi:DNA-binding NtrC family response regulator
MSEGDTDHLPLLLLVEDEPLIRTSLAAALEDSGYALAEADNAEQAIAHLDSEKTFVGVITDIRLGAGRTGWEVARHARQSSAGIAVVYMTGDSAADWTAEGVPNSVLLQKPFATAQVTIAISTLLNAADISPTQPLPGA